MPYFVQSLPKQDVIRSPGDVSPLDLLHDDRLFESSKSAFNSLRPRRSRRHLADEIFKRIFLKENVRISIKISLKFVPRSPIDNMPALFQIMAWRRPGDKPLSEPMMARLPTHICVPRPQWVKSRIRYSYLAYAVYNHGIVYHFALCEIS